MLVALQFIFLFLFKAKKKAISACPSSEQLSNFACPGQGLVYPFNNFLACQENPVVLRDDWTAFLRALLIRNKAKNRQAQVIERVDNAVQQINKIFWNGTQLQVYK